jgi:hypothetical protein
LKQASQNSRVGFGWTRAEEAGKNRLHCRAGSNLSEVLAAYAVSECK